MICIICIGHFLYRYIQMRFTTLCGGLKQIAFFPEANVLVERFNKTLKAMLNKLVGERVQIWDNYLL